MSEEGNKDQEKKTLSLSGGKGGGKGKLTLKSPSAGGNSSGATPAVSRGRGGSSYGGGVAVEVKKRRTPSGRTLQANTSASGDNKSSEQSLGAEDMRSLTSEERQARIKALKEAMANEGTKKREENLPPVGVPVIRHEEIIADDSDSKKDDQDNSVLTQEELRRREIEELQKIEEEEQKIRDEKKARNEELAEIAGRNKREVTNSQNQSKFGEDDLSPSTVHTPYKKGKDGYSDDDDGGSYRDRLKRSHKPSAGRYDSDRRRGKLTVSNVLNEDYERDRGPSMAALRRAKEKARQAAASQNKEPAAKVYREIILPEAITVQELSNRMSERGADVIKLLMKLGVMATINQTIDADTAELVAGEMGHKVKRITESDIETGLGSDDDDPAHMLLPRPPVVTVMGHVDHGKTSLLDAMRQTDVVSGEAGGITQHIGAYQVNMKNGAKITFLDTPGHAAFTEMRSRGANVTDIVVLVVAANDGLMPQTIEAISHSKAAGVPVVVAINKIDLPDANPQKVKQELLSHELIVEEMGGDVLCLEVSAKQKINLDKLEEAILLQAEILELRANPNRKGEGVVVESRQEVGRGSVSTVLVQKGTVRIGDAFVAGAEWGRVRAMFDDRGNPVDHALPGQPVEILGLQGTPDSGDRLFVLQDEGRAKEISEYRQRKRREMQAAVMAKKRTTLDDLLEKARGGEKTELPIVIKGDVHGSVEAITGSLSKLTEENNEVSTNVLHSGVGGITESDVTLAKASNGIIVGFNVRANPQARDLAQREGVDIRYYNVIYDVMDDVKLILSGMLSPALREQHIGQAEIRQIFNITKVGKVAGCMVKSGVVKRGAGVRLLRDDVVIHEGSLKTLRRFKDEVKEVKEGMECGIAFENYYDIKEGDVVECYEIVEEKRNL